jgi:hypothetical protein
LQDAYDLPEYAKRTKKNKDFITILDGYEFEEHPTHYKTLAQAPQIVKHQYSTWFTALKDALGLKNKQNILWLEKHWPKVRGLIDDRVRNGTYKPNTKRIHQDALSHVLMYIDKEKYRELTRPWWVDSINISKTYETKRQNNILNEKQLTNFVSYPEMVRQRDKLYVEWQANPKNKKLHMYFLILALNTYIPPLRLNLTDMEVWRERKQPPHNNINYLWERQPGLWSRVINHDKIEHSRKKGAEKIGEVSERQMFDVEEDLPGLSGAGEQLNRVLTESFRILPRPYVLLAVKADHLIPMGKTSYSQAFRSIFKPRKPTQNLIRMAFVTHFHQLPRITYNEKVMLAERMRHTAEVATKSYYKINAPSEQTEGLTDQPQVVKMAPAKVLMVHPPIKRVLKDPKIAAKAYREKNKDRIQEYRKKNRLNINRSKLLWSLNHSFQKSSNVLDKYGIEYSDELKRYIRKV